MKTKLIAILAAITLLCSVFVGMTLTAAADDSRGFGMSLSEWQDDYGQGKEYDDGSIGIGADAHLKSPLYGESISLDMEFTVLPAVDFWYVLAFANSPQFVGGSVHGAPDRANFTIMFQPGAESMNVNIFHWWDNGSGLTREDIALGPVLIEGGLNANEPFTVNISLFGENPTVEIKQGELVSTMNLESHPQLGNVKKEEIADSYGRVFMNVASYAADSALKELSFSKIETFGGVEDVRNWSGTGVSASGSGVELTQDALYLRPIDVSSKYIKITMNVNMIIGNVDAWAAISLGKTAKIPNQNTAGLNIMMRNQGGKIAIQPEKNTFGQGELKLTDFNLGQFVLELEEVEGKMSVSLNRQPVSNSVFDTLTFADFTDENGYTFFGFGSYVQGNQSNNSVQVLGITGDIKAKENIYIEVSGVPESGMVGSAITLPAGNVVQADGEEIQAAITVTDPENNAVTVTDNVFTPSIKGTYTVVYTATDSNNETARNEYSITVIDPDDALTMDSIKDINNWVAPYGGVSAVETGMQVFAHSYYKLPLSMNDGALRVSLNVDGLWDGNDTNEATSTDAWVSVGFAKAPAINAPGAGQCNSPCLIVRFNNRDGKLLVSVYYNSIIGGEDIAIEDTFANDSDAIGPATIEIQPNDEGGVLLFVNGKQMRHENLSKVYYSDIVDANNCTYLCFAAYDNDDADQKLPNVQTRCLTLTGLSHEKTEVIEDTTAPEVKVSGVPTTGTVGEKVILPPATVTDDMETGLTEQISVKGPDGKDVSVVNRSFTPQAAGEYTVTYTATDSSGNTSTPVTFTITVAEAASGGGCSSAVAQSGMAVAVAVLLGAAVCAVAIKRKKNS